MALFRNFSVNRRDNLCGLHEYASAKFLDFLGLAKNCAFLDRKLISAFNETVDGHELCFQIKGLLNENAIVVPRRNSFVTHCNFIILKKFCILFCVVSAELNYKFVIRRSKIVFKC